MIDAALAYKPGDLIRGVAYAETLECCLLTCSHHLLSQYGSADGSGDVEMGRDNDLFPQYLLKGSHHGLIVGHPALEEDLVSYPAVSDHLLKVVVYY